MTVNDVLEKLGSKCKCGGNMIPIYNEDTGRLTARKCDNPVCPYHMSKRVVYVLRNILKVKGIGEATALDTIKTYGLSHHMQALALLLNGQPEVYLYDYLKMLDFEGIDSKWKDLCDTIGVYEPEKFLEQVGNIFNEKTLAEFKDNLKFVKIVLPTSMVSENTLAKLNIMVTGTPNGFASKDQFFEVLNYVFNGYIVLHHQVTKKKSDVHALIREEGSKTRGKYECALSAGIPILTSKEFIAQCLKSILDSGNKIQPLENMSYEETVRTLLGG